VHELPITESILKIVLKHAHANNVHKVMAVHLRIGKLSDLEGEWIQRYFDYLSKGTLVEGAKLKIERMPIIARCNACAESYEVDVKDLKDFICTACGGKEYTLISGREYYIKDMEVQ